MERLVASHVLGEHTRGYGMLGYDMERRGRIRSFVVTGVGAFALFWLQTLPWMVSTGRLKSRVPLEPLISPRLSLLFDFLFLVALVFHAIRASDLVLMVNRRMPMRKAERGWRRPLGDEPAKTLLRVVLVILGTGVVLDVIENVWLWGLADTSRASRLSVPGLTRAVWIVLFIGVVTLWALSGWAIRRAGSEKSPENLTPAAAINPVVVAPSPPSGTVIACSGGGIRSASFCLGGLQVLSARGIYDDARFVVGVSGGGYIAAAMHIVRARRGFDHELNPAAFADSSPEEAWLRRNTRFLLESARVAALGGLSLLYGIAVNLFLVGSVLVFAAWWMGWFYAASGGLTDWNKADASAAQYDGSWRWVSVTTLLPVAALVAFFAVDAVDRLFRVPGLVRKATRGLCVLMLTAGVAAILVLYALPWLLVLAHDSAATSGSAAARLISAAGLIPRSVCDSQLAIGDACGAAGGPSVTGASLVSFGVILTAIITVLRSARRFLPDAAGAGADAGQVRKLVDRATVRLLPWAALLVIVLAVVTLLLRWTTALVADPELLGHWRWFYIVGVGFLALRIFTDANRTSLHYFYRERLSKAFVLERTPSGGVQPVDYSEQLRFSVLRPLPGQGPELIACASANVSDNDVVPADRNCVPFSFGHHTIGLSGDLFPSEARTASRLFEFNADHGFRVATIPAAMAMSGAAISPLSGRFTRRLAPYRVVMALANARLGVWLPNPLWIESGRVFRRLVKLRNAGEVTAYFDELGEGAATADLRLERLKSRDLVWLSSLDLDRHAKTLIEKELSDTKGPLPGQESAEEPKAIDVIYKWVREVFERPGAFRLAKEAFGKTSVYDRFLYITDGGHYDNLGLVEALRHRPSEVYVLDASSDPEDSFSTLGQAIATARMDLGCEVDFNPRPLKRQGDKPPLVSYGTGSVTYADGATGDLYYVKAIVTAKLPWDIEAYADEHTTFPRTSTTNQLYGEFDLEAYRVLGREATRKLLDPPVDDADPSADTDAATGPEPHPANSGNITADQLPPGNVS